MIKYFIIFYNTVKSDKFNYIIYYFETVVAGSCSCRITDYLFVKCNCKSLEVKL